MDAGYDRAELEELRDWVRSKLETLASAFTDAGLRVTGVDVAPPMSDPERLRPRGMLLSDDVHENAAFALIPPGRRLNAQEATKAGLFGVAFKP